MITLPHIYQLTGVEKQVLVCTKHSSIMNLVAKEISSFVYKNTSISLFSNRGYFWKLHIQYLVGKNIFQHLLEFHHLQYNSNTILDPWHLISPFPPSLFLFFDNYLRGVQSGLLVSYEYNAKLSDGNQKCPILKDHSIFGRNQLHFCPACEHKISGLPKLGNIYSFV